jgi:HAD superfamily hydrolase (TIGR01490 family)
METISSIENYNAGNYIVFFDLDQTLTRSISGKALTIAGFRKGLFRTRDIFKAVFLTLAYRFNIRNPSGIVDEMVSWVRGIPENKMDDLCSEVFRNAILPSVYKDAMAEIAFHKTKNARIVILSSALKNICRDMAENLALDDFICSELQVRDGVLTGFPLGRLCFGKEKAVRLLAYCENNNISPSDAWYYGDSISDLSALSSVGNPVCVNPDNRLKKVALKNGWKIVSWKN